MLKSLITVGDINTGNDRYNNRLFAGYPLELAKNQANSNMDVTLLCNANIDVSALANTPNIRIVKFIGYQDFMTKIQEIHTNYKPTQVEHWAEAQNDSGIVIFNKLKELFKIIMIDSDAFTN